MVDLRRRLRGVLLSCVAVAGVACATPDPSEEIQVQRSALSADGLTEQQYVDQCAAQHVPRPPVWGKKVGSAPPGWTARGAYTDSFVNSAFNGNVYYAVDSSQTTPGICVIAYHSGGLFDLICQGTNGVACFWEGNQPEFPTIANVPLAPSGSWGGPLAITSAAKPNVLTPCTSCHEGQNVFLNHYATNHPLNLLGLSGWMPSSSAWMQPFVPSTWPQNPDPGMTPFNSLPTSNCLNCHSSSLGGRFPTLGTDPLSASNYCGILEEVTNRPAWLGGMPPTFPDGTPNQCTPGLDCARQTDPFVKAMLKYTCNRQFAWPDNPVARAAPGTPATMYAYSASGPSWQGSWEHIAADGWVGNTTHQLLRWDNFWNANFGSFSGWSSANDLTSFLATPFAPSVYLKDPNYDGSKLAVVTTNYEGSVGERGPNGTLKPINTTLAAGAPWAYERHDGQSVIVYRGYDNLIHEIWWNGSSWASDQALPNPAGTTPMGDPIGYKRSSGSGGSSSVIWVCGQSGSSTTICEDRIVNGFWYPRSFTTAAKIKDDGMGDMYMPRPNRDSWGGYLIAYTGVDGLHVINDPSEPWYGTPTDVKINSDTTIASAPAPYGDQNGYTSIVYRTLSGSMSAIMEMRGNGAGGYTQATVLPATSDVLTDDPAAFVAVAPWTNTIIYRNQAHRVYQRQWSYGANAYVSTTVF